jgi:hypothetical protein
MNNYDEDGPQSVSTLLCPENFNFRAASAFKVVKFMSSTKGTTQ